MNRSFLSSNPVVIDRRRSLWPAHRIANKAFRDVINIVSQPDYPVEESSLPTSISPLPWHGNLYQILFDCSYLDFIVRSEELFEQPEA